MNEGSSRRQPWSEVALTLPWFTKAAATLLLMTSSTFLLSSTVVAQGVCTVDEDCPSGQVCQNGSCYRTCTVHYDCLQGEYCFAGTCRSDPNQPVYHCGKPGCPPGWSCLDSSGIRGRCAEDPGYSCQDACDCGPAHACMTVPSVGRTCVKDGDDPYLPGASIYGITVPSSVPTYCCSQPDCHGGQAAYLSDPVLTHKDFYCYHPLEDAVQHECGKHRCYGQNDCAPGEVCLDYDVPEANNLCQAGGGWCVPTSTARAIYQVPSSSIFDSCLGCPTGLPCVAGWRPGGGYAFAPVIGICGSCGNGFCDSYGEYPDTCPQDCLCGDGVCAPAEVNTCAADCGECGDGICGPLETAKSCPSDCAPVCGDLSCSQSEAESGSCPGDCLCPNSDSFTDFPSVCGDGVCQQSLGSPENCVTCTVDCGPPDDLDGDGVADCLSPWTPPNNSCEAATPVTLGSHAGSLVASSNDGMSSCGGDKASDVWFAFTAPAAGTLQVDTCGTNDMPRMDVGIDTLVSILSACPQAGGGELACNDDWPSGSAPMACSTTDAGLLLDSAVTATVAGGQTVRIRVSRFTSSSDGSFILNVSFTPANDACVNAVPVAEGTWLGTLDGAMTDGSASCATVPVEDVWYSYLPPASGSLHVQTCGTHDMAGVDTGIDSIVSLHQGCPGTAANEIPGMCNDDWPSGLDPTACAGQDVRLLRDSAVLLPINAGAPVYIRVSRYATSAPGPFALSIIPEFAPVGRVEDLGIDFAGTDLLLSWSAGSCGAAADYEIYEGTLGSFGGHVPVSCSTDGLMSFLQPMPSGDAYYLVVPTDLTLEGSYGLDGYGAERPPSVQACKPRATGTCN